MMSLGNYLRGEDNTCSIQAAFFVLPAETSWGADPNFDATLKL